MGTYDPKLLAKEIMKKIIDGTYVFSTNSDSGIRTNGGPTRVTSYLEKDLLWFGKWEGGLLGALRLAACRLYPKEQLRPFSSSYHELTPVVSRTFFSEVEDLSRLNPSGGYGTNIYKKLLQLSPEERMKKSLELMIEYGTEFVNMDH